MSWFEDLVPSQRCPAGLTAAMLARGLRPGRPTDCREPGIVFVGAGADGSTPPLPDGPGQVLVVLLPGAVHDPWTLLSLGAADVVTLADFDLDDAVARLDRWAEVDRAVASPTVSDHAVGCSRRWLETLREVVEAALFTTSPVLLVGETGTGKEVLARLVHDLDRRRPHRELVVLDCGSVVPTLAGSEFFGHERGAFTGATAARPGAFELAHRGTLFLDEVGELPPELQTALLRVVQEGTYKRVGGTQWFETRFRLVAATNRDLERAVTTGGFRADLYHRLAATVIRLPPLADRRDDIVLLFRRFVADCGTTALTDDVRDLLLARDYPGNVRDLRQLATRVAARHVGRGPVTVGDIPPADRPGDPATDGPSAAAPAPADWRSLLRAGIRGALADGVRLKELKELVPGIAVQLALTDAGGPTGAARLLGVSRRAVEYRTAGAARPRVGGRVLTPSALPAQGPAASSPTSSRR